MRTSFDGTISYLDHKKRLLARFQREYLEWLLDRSSGSLNQAARVARMDRKCLRSLMRKHGIILQTTHVRLEASLSTAAAISRP